MSRIAITISDAVVSRATRHHSRQTYSLNGVFALLSPQLLLEMTFA